MNKWYALSDVDRLAVTAELAKHGIDNNADPGDRSGWLKFRADVRRVINDKTSSLKSVIEKNENGWNADLQAKYDAGMKLLDSLSALVEYSDLKLTGFDVLDKVTAESGASNWRDRDGSNIKVLSPRDSFRAAVGGARQDFGFGDYVKAMVAGTSSPEIRAALTEGTDSTGGYTVPSFLMGEVIDAMRAKTVCVQAGARTVPLEGYQNTIVRIATDPIAGWRLENAAIAEGSPTFEGLVLQPKSLAVLVKVSRELIDDSMNIADALTMAFAGSMAAEVDRVALIGSGTNPEPRGIYNTVGINVVSMGTNGAALTSYAPILDAQYELELDNAPAPGAMVMHPRTGRVLNGLADSTGQPLQVPPSLSGIVRHATTNIPVDLTQGTATNASAIILGDFTQLLLGVRSELRIELLRERFADAGQYAFIAHMRMDVAVAQPEAFCAVKGIIPAA